MAKPLKPAIPIIVLANVHSLDNKLDYIPSTSLSPKDFAVFFEFVETWLSIPDDAIQLDRLACYQADRALVKGS